MNRTTRRPALVSLLAVLLFVALGPAPAGGRPQLQAAPVPEEESTDALRHEYDEIAGDQADLLVEFDRSTRRLAQLRRQSALARAKVLTVDASLAQARANLARTRRAEGTAKTDLVDARKRVRQAEGELRDHAVEAYISGGTLEASVLLAILENDDSSSNRVSYTDAVTERQTEIIEDLQTARRDRDDALATASSARSRATRQQTRVADLRRDARAALTKSIEVAADVDRVRRMQSLALITLTAKKVNIQARIAMLVKASDNLAKLLASLQATSAAWTPGAIQFQSPAPGTLVSSGYGLRRHPILGITRLHAGVDLGAATGQPVLAAADGVVVSAQVQGGYGNVVAIDHGFSIGTVYAHNSAFVAKPGQIVRRGDVIALAGSTGLSTGPHIHFETRVRGVPVDPRSLVMFG